jgi:hypothetical protein
MRNEVKDYQHEQESETEVLHDKNPAHTEIKAVRRTRLRTAKEASELLEELRKLYQSLTPQEQCGVKSFMSDLWKSQHQLVEAQ